MFEPKGNALFACVTCLTSLGFLLIGFDNGLMGGVGKEYRSWLTLFQLV
jgi:hypothetical protein